jgi:hypothetical protein
VIGDMAAWQRVIPLWREEPSITGQPRSPDGAVRSDRAVAGLVTQGGRSPTGVTSPAKLSHPD